MAKVTIIIQDKPEDSEDGNLDIIIDYDPAIERGAGMTPAQIFGAQLSDAFMGEGSVMVSFGEEDDE